MNVSLTPELEQYVQEKVSSGLYYSASEVIREGVAIASGERSATGGAFAAATARSASRDGQRGTR